MTTHPLAHPSWRRLRIKRAVSLSIIIVPYRWARWVAGTLVLGIVFGWEIDGMDQIGTWTPLQQWAFRIFEWYSRCIGACVCDPKQACDLLPLTRPRLPEIPKETRAPLEYRDRLSIARFCRMSICLLLSSTIALSFYLMTIAQAL